MKAVRIALVEIGGSHDECLLTQINALQTVGAVIHLIVDQNVLQRNRNQLSSIHQFYEVNTTGAAIGDVKLMQKIVQYLKENEIEKVVFNTAQGGHVRNLALLLPKNIRCYGIIHTIRKFNDSFTQKVINRAIKRYAVLSDDLLKRVKRNEKLYIQSFYPIDFPITDYSVEKPENETWITIPGGVEIRRKDLSVFPEFIQNTASNLKFIFLGKSDKNREDVSHFLQQINDFGLNDRIRIFEDFVPMNEFFAILKKTDFLLPLIHPDTESARQYITNQISGSFNLSFGLKIPLLIHEAYQKEDDLVKSACFYSIETFGQDFENALRSSTDKIVEMAAVEKWTTSFQYNNYLRFIELL